MTTYVSCADTAKQARAMLKAEFPGVKFSVRSDSYAGGASIRIYWLDGPTESAVKSKVSVFEGSTFDGMIDLKSPMEPTLVANPDGTWETVSWGADYVFTNRTLSPEFEAELAAMFAARYGHEYVRHAVYHEDRWYYQLVSETTGSTHKVADLEKRAPRPKRDPKRIDCVWFLTDRSGKRRARYLPVKSMRSFPLALDEAETLAAEGLVTVVEHNPYDFGRPQPRTLSERREEES